MCTGQCTYDPTRLAAVQAQRGGFYWLRPCRRPLVWWLLLVCLAGPIILGIILISFWCHFWDLWASFGDHWALVSDTWARSLLYGGPCIECDDFVGRFWTLRGSPFSPLGVTISFPWVWIFLISFIFREPPEVESIRLGGCKCPVQGPT